jgi:hypothetical protein
MGAHGWTPMRGIILADEGASKMHTVDMGLMPLARALELGLVRPVRHEDSLPKEMGGLSRMVEDLVLNTQLSYEGIVAQVKEAYPHANTSTKSVASVACVMRKKGKPVPYRLKLNA